MRAVRNGLSVMLAAVLLMNSWVFAESRKDISDPVLQEIIESFGPRMPRFIDKHGAGIFVADEPITRGNLMLALYEYDKSFKLSKKEYVSKQEFDEFRTRLAATREAAHSAKNAGNPNIMDVINELQPNMGALLDSSLASSKVFMNLKSAIEAKQGTALASAGGDDLAKTQAELGDLERRIDGIEKTASTGAGRSAAQPAANGVSRQEFQEIRDKLAQVERSAQVNDRNSSAAVPEEIRGNAAQTRKDMELLVKRLDNIESRINAGSSGNDAIDGSSRKELRELYSRLARLEKDIAASADSDNFRKANAETNREIARLNKRIDEIDSGGASGESSGELRQYASALTKITLGLGMVAAFFIAR